MIKRNIKGVDFLQFELFQQFPRLKHAIFLRKGGVSNGNFASLNLSHTVSDDPELVSLNLKKILYLFELEDIVVGKLAHGKTIVEAERNGFSNDIAFDGVTTRLKNLALLITHADCQAAIFYDPLHHAIANVHAGWRGSCLNIYQETIAFMKKTYGTNPKDLHVGISPSLGPSHAEFINYKVEFPQDFWPFQIKSFHFNFWEISKRQLIAAGLLEKRIEIAKICTYSNSQDFFSYRRDGLTGRNATVVALM